MVEANLKNRGILQTVGSFAFSAAKVTLAVTLSIGVLGVGGVTVSRYFLSKEKVLSLFLSLYAYTYIFLSLFLSLSLSLSLFISLYLSLPLSFSLFISLSLYLSLSLSFHLSLSLSLPLSLSLFTSIYLSLPLSPSLFLYSLPEIHWTNVWHRMVKQEKRDRRVFLDTSIGLKYDQFKNDVGFTLSLLLGTLTPSLSQTTSISLPLFPPSFDAFNPNAFNTNDIEIQIMETSNSQFEEIIRQILSLLDSDFDSYVLQTHANAANLYQNLDKECKNVVLLDQVLSSHQITLLLKRLKEYERSQISNDEEVFING
jgi:hypothetical protein